MTKSKWGDGSANPQALVMSTTTPASGDGSESDNVANGTAKDTMLDLQVAFEVATSILDESVRVYLIYTGDAKEYGGPGNEPTKQLVANIAGTDDQAAIQTHFIDQIPVPPRDFTVLIWNSSQQPMSNLEVKAWTYLHESN